MQAKINNQAVNWVNLGLPSGTLWAVFNVGTNNFDNPGEKFALENYRIRNTEWRNEDPVKTYMGENWRMPTKAEWDELMQYCTKHGYSDGLVFKSKINGQTIGFPCDASGKGYYWSSTLIDDRNMYSGELMDSYSAYRLEFDINIENVGVVKGLTSTGCYVRGVLVNKATAKLINDAAHKKWDNLKAQGKPYENVPLLRGEIYIYFLGGEAMSNSTTTPTNRTSDASNATNPSQTNITSNTNNPSQTNAPSNTNNPPQTNTPSNSDAKYVDLGLPSGTLWADRNIGASNPEEYGDYFAWGETNPKSNYTWSTLKYCEDNNGDKFSKYNTQSKYGTILERSDDAAAANWGSGWCMPTQEQFQELKDKCTWTLTTKNGKKGYEVKGLNGNALFLPAAGCRLGTDLYYSDSNGYYWSSSLFTAVPYKVYGLYFESGYVGPGHWFGGRSRGQSVRPVRCK
ncbi:MAG: hypothetical protein II852_05965 [Bacteroidales bacterium]|nr:hypothetical protein [Bacteroidales bacterium]